MNRIPAMIARAMVSMAVVMSLSHSVSGREMMDVTRPENVQSNVDLWATFLHDAYFKDVTLIEDKTVIDMKTPYRAEDAAVTPVSITAQIPQTPDQYIKTLYLIVDNNPQPLVGRFEFSPDSGKADLALRVRIEVKLRIIAALCLE